MVLSPHFRTAEKGPDGQTGFHLACAQGKQGIVEMMIKNAKNFNFDLTAKDNNGRTGFQLEKYLEKKHVTNLIKRKFARLYKLVF